MVATAEQEGQLPVPPWLLLLLSKPLSSMVVAARQPPAILRSVPLMPPAILPLLPQLPLRGVMGLAGCRRIPTAQGPRQAPCLPLSALQLPAPCRLTPAAAASARPPPACWEQPLPTSDTSCDKSKATQRSATPKRAAPHRTPAAEQQRACLSAGRHLQLNYRSPLRFNSGVSWHSFAPSDCPRCGCGRSREQDHSPLDIVVVEQYRSSLIDRR